MDFFRLLGAGAKFNKEKYSSDYKTFDEKKTTTCTSKRLEENPELDIFAEEKPSDIQIKPTKNVQEESVESLAPIATESEANIWRKQHNIKVYGTDVPFPFKTFTELANRYKFKPFLRKNLTESGFHDPTPIQMQSIPIILHARDVMACAPTGSGKTLSFLVPLLHSLQGPTKEGFRALIISPTRELAQQIYREVQKLSVGKPFKVLVLSKATNISNPNIAKSISHFDIIISTPLRLVYALKEDAIKLHGVKHIVLDEADKLLDQGFLDQVDDILAACTNSSIQKSLFSATITSGVEELAKTFMLDPLRIIIGQKNAATSTIGQKLLYVGQEEGKLVAMRQLIQGGLKPPVLIFVQSIDRAKELFHELIYDGINVDVIHSERTQLQRDNIIQNFRLGKIWVLISTELMARGIDFKGVNMVINYDFPQSIQSYIHRIGRTGRAGRKGEAITYFTKEDGPFLKSIVNVMKESGCEVPDWMLTLKKPTKTQKKMLKRKPMERDQIKTISGYDEKKYKKKREMIQGSKRRQQNSE